MTLDDIAKKVAQFAPMLGAVLPIPGGVALGQVVASMFGGVISNPDDLIERINADPDARLKLQQFEMDHKLELQKIALSAYQAELNDKASARDRERVLGDKSTSRIAFVFTSSYLFLTFALIVVVGMDVVNSDEVEMIKDIVKEMSLAQMLILSYYFGASRMSS